MHSGIVGTCKKASFSEPVIFSTRFGCLIDEPSGDRLHGKEYGKFEVKALQELVRAYGLLWVTESERNSDRIGGIEHKDMCHVLRRLLHGRREYEGIILAGGMLEVDYDAHSIVVFGQSGYHGRLPAEMVLPLINVAGFSTSLLGGYTPEACPGQYNDAMARIWYAEFGYPVVAAK